MSDSTPTPEAKPDWQERALSAEVKMAEQTDQALADARRVMSLNIRIVRLEEELAESQVTALRTALSLIVQQHTLHGVRHIAQSALSANPSAAPDTTVQGKVVNV